MRRFIAIAGTVLACACSVSAAPIVDRPLSYLSKSDAERLMLRADDIRRLSVGQVGLAGVFRGRALQLLSAQAESLARRGIRVEEGNASRTLVFWDARAAEAILEVIGRRRIVTGDDPNPGWIATVRQWWARLQFADATWWIVDEQDLPPDRWRKT